MQNLVCRVGVIMLGRVVAIVGLGSVVFVVLALSGGLKAPSPAAAIQYCVQGCSPLVPPLIAFQSNRDTPGSYTEVYIMNADGSGQTRLFANDDAFDGAPSWSPDGQKLAFESYRDGNSEIYV